MSLFFWIMFISCKMYDQEVWWGQVSDKTYHKSSCSHRYCSNTTVQCTGSGKSQNCRSVCTSYSYHHRYDYSWTISYDYNGDQRTDEVVGFKSCGDCRLNTHEKEIWEDAVKGKIAAVPHTYKNYLKVDENSLEVPHSNYEAQNLPSYPTVRNFHEFNNVIGPVINKKIWEDFLLKTNFELGSKKQVHIIVVTTTDPNPAFADALAAKWLLGKKNNAIFVFGVDSSENITWSRLISFSKLEMMRIRVRDDFKGRGINEQTTMDLVKSEVVEHYKRDSMSDKRYLMTNTWWYRWGGFLCPIFIPTSLLGLLFFVHKRRRSR